MIFLYRPVLPGHIISILHVDIVTILQGSSHPFQVSVSAQVNQRHGGTLFAFFSSRLKISWWPMVLADTATTTLTKVPPNSQFHLWVAGFTLRPTLLLFIPLEKLVVTEAAYLWQFGSIVGSSHWVTFRLKYLKM